MPKPVYQIFIRNIVTNDIFELPFISLAFTEELNKGRDARVSMDFRSAKAIADVYNTDILFLFTSGLRELWIQKHEVKVYIGVISDLAIQKDDKGFLRVDIASVGYLTLFSKRRTSNKRVFTATDAGQIAKTLIDESQQSDLPYSDLGITFGAIASSVNRDRTYRFDNIKDAIVKLSNENLNNGFDFDIDNSKVFNVYYPTKGTIKPNIFFDEVNIINYRFRKPLVLSLTNQVYVIGEGFNDAVLFTKRTSPVDYRAVFALLEDVLADRDVKEITTLVDHGDKFLLDNQSPRIGLEINHIDGNPDINDYELGDTFKIKIPELSIFNEIKRVYKRAFSIDTNSLATVTITVR
ncbi:MAG: hypothetical protein Q7K45_03845 [Nanoarchaeota archaeon]|nr:hypothetical protein [Nanoarchaeota archaeon]